MNFFEKNLRERARERLLSRSTRFAHFLSSFETNSTPPLPATARGPQAPLRGLARLLAHRLGPALDLRALGGLFCASARPPLRAVRAREVRFGLGGPGAVGLLRADAAHGAQAARVADGADGAEEEGAAAGRGGERCCRGRCTRSHWSDCGGGGCGGGSSCPCRRWCWWH